MRLARDHSASELELLGGSDESQKSEEKFQLGRYLFYDERLSGNETQSCSTCHLQELAFTDGLTLAIGSTDQVHPRNSQTLVNLSHPSVAIENSVTIRTKWFYLKRCRSL